MKDIAKYVPLETVVKHYMGEAILTGAHYLRLYQLAVRGLTELGMDITEEPKTELLPVEQNKTVYLPHDYIQWIKVGVFNDKGEVATLRRNDNMTFWGWDSDTRSSENVGDDLYPVYPYHNDAYQNYYIDGSLFNLFGVRDNMDFRGEFRVDDSNGIILLDNDFRYPNIVLEYISNPANDNNLVIPVQAQEALIAWLRWKDIQSLPASRRVTLAEKQTRKNEYYNQRRLARMRLQPTRISDINETIRINNNLVLKA